MSVPPPLGPHVQGNRLRKLQAEIDAAIVVGNRVLATKLAMLYADIAQGLRRSDGFVSARIGT